MASGRRPRQGWGVKRGVPLPIGVGRGTEPLSRKILNLAIEIVHLVYSE